MSEYPHKCPLCAWDAYVGAYAVKCRNAKCPHYEKVEYPVGKCVVGLAAWLGDKYDDKIDYHCADGCDDDDSDAGD